MGGKARRKPVEFPGATVVAFTPEEDYLNDWPIGFKADAVPPGSYVKFVQSYEKWHYAKLTLKRTVIPASIAVNFSVEEARIREQDNAIVLEVKNVGETVENFLATLIVGVGKSS